MTLLKMILYYLPDCSYAFYNMSKYTETTSYCVKQSQK